MSDTLNAETVALLARAAMVNPAQAWRARDESVKVAALAHADSARALRVSERNARDYAARAKRAAWMAAWNTYDVAQVCDAVRHDAACCRYGMLLDIWSRTPKRATIRRIARAVLASDARVERCKNCAVEDSRCDAHTIPADWRDTVRAFIAGRAESRAAGGFMLSRDDMRADTRSRFYRNVTKHWHDYAGGRHVAIAGVTPDDVVQDAFLAAIESRDGLSFDTMYGHVRIATETAVYSYRRYGNGHASDNVAEWTWADWQDWASKNDAQGIAYSTLEEWQAYDAAKLAEEADAAYRRRVESRRDVESTYLDAAQSALVTLVRQGLTVRRIAHILGRTVEGLTADIVKVQQGTARLV